MPAGTCPMCGDQISCSSFEDFSDGQTTNIVVWYCGNCGAFVTWSQGAEK